jgi:hypothetical protein
MHASRVCSFKSRFSSIFEKNRIGALLKIQNPPLPAFFCSRAAAVFRQGFISPKIGIYPVSMYQERKTTTPV